MMKLYHCEIKLPDGTVIYKEIVNAESATHALGKFHYALLEHDPIHDEHVLIIIHHK